VAGGGAAAAGLAAGVEATPRSHGICSPAFRAAISSSVSGGRFLRWRYACSMPITELFNAGRGQGGRWPRTPLAKLFVDSSAIRPL
jgi:hypothetical protein